MTTDKDWLIEKQEDLIFNYRVYITASRRNRFDIARIIFQLESEINLLKESILKEGINETQW